MAPQSGEKRRRTRDDNAEEELLDSQTASSRLSRDVVCQVSSSTWCNTDGTQPHKRPRVSRNATVESGSEEEQSHADAPSPASDPSPANDHADSPGPEDDVDYEAMRDADDAGMDEETMRRNQTQIMERRLANFKENHAAENAIIEEIRCTNFMCHSKLHLTLGPLINFIIGHNGSGKSAALTALQLCLGGKATDTNRGQKLSDFIKHGEDYCVLSVRIKNQGISAFKPDEFGQSIIVERHFNRQGVTTFKLKNTQGRVVSTKKSELEDFKDAFALQLENPMMCLTQDQAREFLNTSGPKEKYKFFFKGTQLETLDNDYRMMFEMLEELRGRLEKLEEDKKTARRAFEMAKAKAEQAKEAEGARDKFAKLGRQMAWIQVEEQEEILRECEQNIRLAEQHLEERHRAFEAASETFEQANSAVDELQAAIDGYKQGLEPHNVEKETVREEFNEGSKQLQELQVQNRQINSAVESADRQMKKLEADIESENERIRDANGGQYAQKLDDLQAAKQEAERLSGELHGFGSRFRDLDLEKQEAEEAEVVAKDDVRQAREALQAGQRSLKTLEDSRGQWLRAYDDGKQTMKRLLNAIDGDTRFKKKPVGPYGRHVRILKPEWTSIVESSFGQHLSAFCVTSKDDERVLSDLMRRNGANYLILIGDSRPIDTSRNEPDRELVTWGRILEFDNDLVRNQAIINQSIEQTVLIRDREEAVRFMDVRSHGGRPPPHVKRTFAMHDTKPREGHSFTYTLSGDSSMGPIRPYDRPSRMNTDDEYQITEARNHLQTLNSRLKETEKLHQEKQQSLTQAKQAIVRTQREQRAVKLKQEAAQDEALKLQDELDTAATRPDKLNGLEEQLLQTRDELQNAENQLIDSVEEKRSINERQRGLKRKLDQIDEQIKSIQTQVDNEQLRLGKLSKKRRDALYQKNEVDAQSRDAARTVERRQGARDQQQITVDNITGQAAAYCQRVPVDPGKTGRGIEKEMEDLEKIINDTERRLGGNLNELTRRVVAARIQAEGASTNYKHTTNLSLALKMALQVRLTRWRKFRDLISSRAKIQFHYLLSERKFRGQLKLKHVEKLLEIQVEPDITRSSDKGRQTKTLSGGEKSFSTICLLLSLWDAMGNPIRCLDEFDVFMDSVNRDVSMKMMIDAARRSVSKQFILISPQSMNSTHMGPDVHIIK